MGALGGDGTDKGSQRDAGKRPEPAMMVFVDLQLLVPHVGFPEEEAGLTALLATLEKAAPMGSHLQLTGLRKAVVLPAEFFTPPKAGRAAEEPFTSRISRMGIDAPWASLVIALKARGYKRVEITGPEGELILIVVRGGQVISLAGRRKAGEQLSFLWFNPEHFWTRWGRLTDRTAAERLFSLLEASPTEVLPMNEPHARSVFEIPPAIEETRKGGIIRMLTQTPWRNLPAALQECGYDRAEITGEGGELFLVLVREDGEIWLAGRQCRIRETLSFWRMTLADFWAQWDRLGEHSVGGRVFRILERTRPCVTSIGEKMIREYLGIPAVEGK